MRIQHNIMAMNAYRNYTNNVSAMKKNLERLSSGYKINRAGDDAAGLAISEKMRAQITGLETAQKNAKDGISLVQTAEGALTEVHDMLNRMVELATQSANGTYDDTTDRWQMQKEVNQLLDEINRIADSSNFNGINLLDGSLGMNKEAINAISYLDAAEATEGEAITVQVGTVHGQNAADFKKPSATINLGDVKIKNDGTGTATVTVTVNIGSVALTVDMTGVGVGSEVSASDIATALTTKYTATSATATAGASSGVGVNIGGALYRVTGNAGALTLELYGVVNASGTAVDAITSTANTEKFTSDMAASFTAKIDPGANVSISIATASGVSLNNVDSIYHGLTDYGPASAKGDAHRWGADVTLSTDLMKDGAMLTIGVGTNTRTFTVKISDSATDSSVSTNDVIISTKKVGTAAADQLKKFVELLENEDAGLFKVTGIDDSTIHIDVRTSVTSGQVSTWSTATIKKAVSAKEADVAEHNAAVEFTLDDSKLAKGDVIKIGNGSNAKSFVYQGTGANGFTSAADLKTKLQAIYTGTNPNQVATAAASNGGVKFTIYASTATGAAPMVQGRGLTLQIGDTSDSFNQLNVAVQDMHAVSLGISGLNIANEVDAQAAIQKIKDAINTVSDVRGTLGATQNRLDHTINNLSVMTENIQDAESTIRDTDVAEEMMAYTKNNILIQSAQAMLAQANQVPQGVLQLLG